MLSAQCTGCERFFDIGANFGFVSYVMLSRCDNLHVIAFEPNPSLFHAMSMTRERSQLARFTPVHAGLGSHADKLTLHISSVNSGHSTFGPHPGLIGSTQHCRDIVVPVVAFDQWCEREGLTCSEKGAWVAKIDVEGKEIDVVEGMAVSLSEQRFRCVCIEVNTYTLSFCGHIPDDLLNSMARFGYKPYDVNGNAVSADEVRHHGNLFFMPK